MVCGEKPYPLAKASLFAEIKYSPVSPFASCPNSEEPVVYKIPSSSKATEKSSPHAIFTKVIPGAPIILHDLSVPDSLAPCVHPHCPDLLVPVHEEFRPFVGRLCATFLKLRFEYR